MAKTKTWEDFLETKNANTPPQGKGSAPYHAPHTQNTGKVEVKVAEKSDKKGLGDEGTPAFKGPDDIIPNGKKSNDTSTLKQATIKSEAVAPKDKTGSGKPKVRVTEKPSGKNFGDLGTAVMMNRKHVHPMGEKPNYNGLTTEDFVKQTKTMTTAEFISAMLAEGADDLDDLGSDDDADAPSFGDMDDDEAGPDMEDDLDDDLDDEEDGDDEDDLGDETPDIPPMRCQYTGRSVTPAAHEVTKYMAHMLPHNERAVRMFVQELKSVPGALGSLMGEMVGHSELYDEMVNQIGVGKTKVARRFVKAMQENHQKFMQEMGMLQSDPSLSESVSLPMSQRLPSQSLTPQTPSVTNQPGAGPMAGGSSPTAAPAMIQDQPGDGTAAVSPIGKAPVQGQEGTRAKLNKEFAYHHMIKEMKKYNNMAQTMREILGG